MNRSRLDRRAFIKGASALGLAAAVGNAPSREKPRAFLARSSQMANDGFAEAPIGVAQYPNYFTSLNGISPYPVRPPWRVAGVDYRVGINAGVSLKDPALIDPAIATRS